MIQRNALFGRWCAIIFVDVRWRTFMQTENFILFVQASRIKFL